MQPTPRLIILKTTREHFERVTRRQMHALPWRMVKARKGDLLLIAEMQAKGPAVVRYAMRLRDQHADETGETEAIWGKRWNFIVEGEDGCWLSSPFVPATLKPEGPYGRGGTLVYVLPEDAEEFLRDGRPAPAV